MIIWRGWGVGLIFIAGATLILFQVGIKAAFGLEFWNAHQPLLGGAGGVLAGAVGLLVRLTLLQPNPQSITDPESGSTQSFTISHDLIWVDIKWWSALIMALGAWYMFTGEIPGVPEPFNTPQESGAGGTKSLSSDPVFWGAVGTAVLVTLVALVVRRRNAPDQAFHSPLLLLGLAAGLPLIFVLVQIVARMEAEQGETLFALAAWGIAALYTFWCAQAAYYRISWDEHTLRIRRLLRKTAEVKWESIKSLKMHTADAIDMHLDHPGLKKHSVSTYLEGRTRFVDMLQRKCAPP